MSGSPKHSHRSGKFRIFLTSLILTASIFYLGTAIKYERTSKQTVLKEDQDERTLNAPHLQEVKEDSSRKDNGKVIPETKPTKTKTTTQVGYRNQPTTTTKDRTSVATTATNMTTPSNTNPANHTTTDQQSVPSGLDRNSTTQVVTTQHNTTNETGSTELPIHSTSGRTATSDRISSAPLFVFQDLKPLSSKDSMKNSTTSTIFGVDGTTTSENTDSVAPTRKNETKPPTFDNNVTMKTKNNEMSINKSTIAEFERQEGVVIVTKLHGSHQVRLLEQSLCLLHHAYNSRVLYDIVVFVTVEIPETELVTVRKLVAPANLTMVVDNQGLQQEIQNLSPKRRKKFLKRCKVTSPENLTWWSDCPGRIAYNWQAEFRSWHIWKHPALAAYKHMMWLDTDAFCTQVWDRDPIAYMIEKDLVILFDNFPCGAAKAYDIQKRVFKAFNTTLCSVKMVDGHLKPKMRDDCHGNSIPDIHGFFHITNLDFYRSDPVQYWVESLIGNCFLCRLYDDQVAVTVPAAILEPFRSRDLEQSGLQLEVFHNLLMDGKRTRKMGGFLEYWRTVGKPNFPEAAKCPVTIGV